MYYLFDYKSNVPQAIGTLYALGVYIKTTGIEEYELLEKDSEEWIARMEQFNKERYANHQDY